MSFDGILKKDLQDGFLSTDVFGESVSLSRAGNSYTLKALFDTPSLDGQNLGGKVEAISHQPRLFVSLSDLPEQAASKQDVFTISNRPGFHKAGVFRAVDFANESDGVVVYKLQEVRSV